MERQPVHIEATEVITDLASASIGICLCAGSTSRSGCFCWDTRLQDHPSQSGAFHRHLLCMQSSLPRWQQCPCAHLQSALGISMLI